MTFLTHTHLSADLATSVVARSMRISRRVAEPMTANPIVLAGRYVH